MGDCDRTGEGGFLLHLLGVEARRFAAIRLGHDRRRELFGLLGLVAQAFERREVFFECQTGFLADGLAEFLDSLVDFGVIQKLFLL